jgi:hypothetical protein
MRRMLFLCLSLLALLVPGVWAHELRPAYLELRQTGLDTYDVLWTVPARCEDLRLALYVQFPDDCQHTPPRRAFAGGAYVERWRVQRLGGLTDGTIRIDGLSATLTDVLVRLERLDGTTLVTRLTPSTPSFIIEAIPGRWQAAATYVRLGVEHVMLGVDTIGYVSAPVPPLNVAIALSILFLGPEVVRSWRGETSLTIRYPWVVAFVFGLLHGFGFASELSVTGIPQAELPLALLSFNIGVELGQLGFVAVALLLAGSFRVLDVRWPVCVLRAPGYVVGTCGAYWTIQRTVMLFGG